MTPQAEKEFDPIAAEKNELNNLIEKGVLFTTKKKSILRFFGKAERTFMLREPFLGTLQHLSHQYISMDFNEAHIEQDGISEAKRQMHNNSYRCARIVAIAVLNSYWGIKLLTPFYSLYFLWRLTPTKLFHLTLLVNQLSNMGDFINSIRYLAIQPRTTTPVLIEKPENPETMD